MQYILMGIRLTELMEIKLRTEIMDLNSSIIVRYIGNNTLNLGLYLMSLHF